MTARWDVPWLTTLKCFPNKRVIHSKRKWRKQTIVLNHSKRTWRKSFVRSFWFTFSQRWHHFQSGRWKREKEKMEREKQNVCFTSSQRRRYPWHWKRSSGNFNSSPRTNWWWSWWRWIFNTFSPFFSRFDVFLRLWRISDNPLFESTYLLLLHRWDPQSVLQVEVAVNASKPDNRSSSFANAAKEEEMMIQLVADRCRPEKMFTCKMKKNLGDALI